MTSASNLITFDTTLHLPLIQSRLRQTFLASPPEISLSSNLCPVFLLPLHSVPLTPPPPPPPPWPHRQKIPEAHRRNVPEHYQQWWGEVLQEAGRRHWAVRLIQGHWVKLQAGQQWTRIVEGNSLSTFNNLPGQ